MLNRLTGLITLAIRKCDDFPRVFYYENSADLALSEDDIDVDLVSSAEVLLVTGTHFSRPNLDAASRKAIRIAKDNGRRVAFDIDYRPVLWGLTQHARGEQMFVQSERVSEHLAVDFARLRSGRGHRRRIVHCRRIGACPRIAGTHSLADCSGHRS